MKIDELDPSYLRGIKEDEKPDTEDRSLGQTITDVGIKLAEPVVTAARTVSGAVRAYEDDPHGVAADVDRWLGRQQKALHDEGLSPRQQAIDTNKWFNRGPDDRSAWHEPLTTAASQTLGLVVPGAIAAATGGGSAIGGALVGGALGVLDSGEAINNVRDYIDQADVNDLKKIKAYTDLYRDNGGDDLDARHQLFKQSVDLIDVATNVGANVLSIGALGHALSRAGRKVDSGMMKFLGRAAFGATEGAVAGAAEGAAGELATQRAAVKQGRQQDIDVRSIVSAGEEAIPGMALPVATAHAVRRGPPKTAAEQYGPPVPPPDHPHWSKPDSDVTSVLGETLNPKAIDTGTPPTEPPAPAPPDAGYDPQFPGVPIQSRAAAQQQAQGYANLAQQPPGEQAPTPPELSGPSQAGPPQPGGVWGQARPDMWGNVPREPPPPPGAPPAPPEPPPVGGGIWRGARPEMQARLSSQYGPNEPYGPPAPPYGPPAPPRPGEPPEGGGPYRGPPTAPGPPRFPGIERPGLPTPGEFGGEEEARAPRPAPARTIHVTPQDAQKIRQGVRLVPGAGNSYTLQARGGQSVGRVAAQGPAQGLVPIGIGTDGLVMAKGRPLGAVARGPAHEAAVARGAAEGTAPVVTPGPQYGPPAPTNLGTQAATLAPAAPAAGPSAAEMHAAPLRPGRAMWRSNVGVHEVEILPDEERRGHHKIRYDIVDKAGRHERGEAWVNTGELTQGGGREGGPPGGGTAGGPTAGPGGGSFETTTGGRPARGSLQDQLGDVRAQLFAPSNEPLTREVEETIRGGVSTADPKDRVIWANHLQGLLDNRLETPGQVPALFGRDFPRAMQEHFDAHEWGAMVDAAAQNPQEVIDIIRQPPIGGGINPAVQEFNFRLEGRAARGDVGARQRLGRTRAQRGGFEKIVAVPEGRHALAAVEHEPEAAPAAGPRRTEQFSAEEARRNIRRQEAERRRQTPVPQVTSEEQTQVATAQVDAEEARKQRAARRGTQAEATGGLAIDPVNLKADINAYNLRVDYLNRGVSTDTAVERERLQRIHDSLQARVDQLDALRYRRGLPEDVALKETIAARPQSKLQPRTQTEETAADIARRIERANRSELDLWIKQQSPEVQDSYATAKAITNELVKPRIRLLNIGKSGDVNLRMIPAIARQLWQKLSDSAAGRDYQKKLQAADRARVRREKKVLVEPNQGEFWSGIYRKYWRNLNKTDKGKLLREAAKGMGKTLSPAELRETVIKEVEALHAAARERVLKKKMPPLPIRTAKIPGMRQKPLPRTLPTEREALERMEEVQKRQVSQQRRQASGDKQYAEREQVVDETIKTAVAKRFGTEARFSDLITQLFNHSLVRPPPKDFRDNPTLFQRSRGLGDRRAARNAMSGTRLGADQIEFIVRKKPKGDEEVGERRAEPLREIPAKRVQLTPAQLRAEELEDRQLAEGARYSLRERLRRAEKEGRTEDAERIEGEIEAGGEDEDTATKTPRIRRENIYVAKMEDYFRVKDMQLKEAKQLGRFLDHLIEQLAKNLEKKRVAEGYTGGTVTWTLPQARVREKGLKQGYRGAQLESVKSIAVRQKFSAGEANEQFGAYSFTADLLNLRDAVRFATTGMDSLGGKGDITSKARTRVSSLQARWNRKVGRKGKVVEGPGAQVSGLQEEIARYMGPLNRMLLDFSWRMDKAMQGDWEALKNVRTAQTEEFARATRGESLEAREERQLAATEAGQPMAALADVASEDIGRGKGEAIQATAAEIIDKRVEVTLARAWAKERKAGRLQNVSFDDYKAQHFSDLKQKMTTNFPLGQRGRAVEPVGGPSAFEYDPGRVDPKLHKVHGAAASSRVQWLTLERPARSSLSRPAPVEVAVNPDMAALHNIIDDSQHNEVTVIRDTTTGQTWASTRDNVIHYDLIGALGLNRRMGEFEYRVFGLEKGRLIETDAPRFGAGGIDPDLEHVSADRRAKARLMTTRELNQWLERPHADYRGIQGFDTEGLPLDRRRAFGSDDWDADANDGMGGPTQDALDRMHKDQLADSAHAALFEPGTVDDPTVSEPETTAQSVDRLKQMIREGTAGPLPERYINDSFLDQLARITTGTEVYHAPYDAVAGEDSRRGGGLRGWYSWDHDRIAISNDLAPDLYARSLLHEIMHPATHQRLEDDPVFAKDVATLLDEARAHAERRGMKVEQGILYGLTDPHEYLSESVSNIKFRDFLDSVGKPSLLRRLWDAIRNTFGRAIGFFHGNTALDVLYYDTSSVLGKTDRLIARSMAQIEKEGRKRPLPIDQAQVARNADGRSAVHGARNFIKDIVGETQVWGKDVADRAEYAWETRSKNRARGLGFMTPYDQTKIGRADFRAGMEKAFDTIEKVFAEGNKLRDADKRELAVAAKIYYRWSKGDRQRAAEGMIDESNHGFFADRALHEKGNEHFADTLDNAQAKEEHPAQQAEYAYLAEHLPGYDQFRSIIHNFSARREEEMRKERIRDLVRYGHLLPENLDTMTRERVSEAVRQWIDTTPQRLPPDPSRGKTAERYENMRETLERVPEKNLIKQHVDVENPDVLARVKEIRATPQMGRLPGPYVPFTRQGRFAVSGNLTIPKPANAILLEGDMNHATGQPAGNDRYVFKTEPEARAFERRVSNELGIKQLKEGSGPIDIDIGTGQRALTPEIEDLKTDDPERFKLARGKALQDLKDAGANIEQHYAVQFQKKLLYYAPTEFDAKKITDDLRNHYGHRINVTEPKDVFIRDGRQNEQFVGTALQKQIDSLRQSGAFKRLDTHEQGAVIDRLTSAAAAQVMNRGIKQRYLPRGYVKGASTNILGSMDEYSAYSGRYLANLKHQAELRDRTEVVGNWLKDNEHSKDVLAEQRVYNSMMHRLHSPSENPRDNAINRFVDRALKFTMLDKLPGVAYFITNATDAVAVGLPLMAGRHGMIRAIGSMAGMYKLSRKLRAVGSGLHDLVEALKAGTDMTDYEKQIMQAVEGEADGGRLGRLYQHAFERAMFDRSANLEYQNTYMLNKSVIDKVGDYGTGIFQGVNTAIEAVNRFVTLGTAYRLEFNRLTKKGMGEEAAHEAAVQYAMNIGHEANGIYANFNTPEYFNKGPVAKLIFQFKKYPQRILMNYIRAAQGVIGLSKGEFTEENKERAKQLVYMLATQGVLAGALGMPTEPFAWGVNGLYMVGLSKYNWDDVQAGFRQWANKEFGHEGGQVVSHGVLRWLTGTAIDQRMSQSGLITFGSPASRKQSDLKAAVFNFFAGATGGSAFQAFGGIQKFGAAVNAYADGAHDVAMKNFSEFLRDTIPLRFVTDIIEAANRGTPEGMQTFSGRQMRKPYSFGEQVTRAIGLQPARDAEAGDARRDLANAHKRIMDQKKEFTDEFAQSPPGMQRQRVWEQVQAWNKANPGIPPLTMSDLLRASGTRQKAEKAPSSLLGLPDDKLMKALRPRAGAYVTGE